MKRSALSGFYLLDELTGWDRVLVVDAVRTGHSSGVSAEEGYAAVELAEIERYVASGEPLQCAGGFALEGRGGLLVEQIEGCVSNVIGLSLPEIIILRRVLKPPLIAVFVGVVGVGITFTGYLFNLVL